MVFGDTQTGVIGGEARVYRASHRGREDRGGTCVTRFIPYHEAKGRVGRIGIQQVSDQEKSESLSRCPGSLSVVAMSDQRSFMSSEGSDGMHLLIP